MFGEHGLSYGKDEIVWPAAWPGGDPREDIIPQGAIYARQASSDVFVDRTPGSI